MVVSNKQETEYSNRYIIKIKGENKKLYLYTNRDLKCGNNISFTGTYSKPEDKRNTGGFSYSDYLKTKEIYGTINSNSITVEGQSKNLIIKVKNKIYNNINILLGGESRNILFGILLGDKSEMPDELIGKFRENSLSHILAVSGAHITYIIIGLKFILEKLKINKRFSYIFICFILVFYMLIIGCSPSILRATIMSLCYIFSKIIFRKYDLLNGISISILIILLLNPFSILDIGLILSFGGISGIFLFYKLFNQLFLRIKMNKKICELLSLSFSVQIILIPIIMAYFNNFSISFLLSSVLTSDLFGLITILGFIMISLSFASIKVAKYVSLILNLIIKILVFIVNLIAKIPFLNYTTVTPSYLEIFLYYCGIFIWLYYWKLINKKSLKKFEMNFIKLIKNINFKKIIIIILVILSCIAIYKIYPQNLKINMIDVGQRRFMFNNYSSK